MSKSRKATVVPCSSSVVVVEVCRELTESGEGSDAVDKRRVLFGNFHMDDVMKVQEELVKGFGRSDYNL